nr:hypothetical protein [Tanacetum cinerariifolium]
MRPEDSLIMENEDLSTIPINESDEFIKSNVEDHVQIPSESEDMSDSECDLPFCGNSMTFSNPLFDSNKDFTSSDDESLSDEDVPEDKVKIYSNPLFKFDDEYISSDVNPLFDEMLGDIKNKDSYVSNLDELDLLVTPLFDANEDECFDQGFINKPPLENNDDLFDLESKENECKWILYDAPIDDLMTEDKVFDLGIHEKFFLQLIDDESLSDMDVPKDNVRIYSNPLFKFDDEYIFNDVNPLFDEVLENIENKDSYYSNLDEPDLLVTPLSDANEDECFNPGDDIDKIELLIHRGPSTPKMSVASILEGFTNEPPLEENADLFDLKSKENKWKKILYDAPIDDLMTEDKIFDPGIPKKFSNICELTL